MPSVDPLPARRLTVALLVALVVTLAALAGPPRAHADESGIFENRRCGTSYFQKVFTVPATSTHLRLTVHHYPGRWGQMTVKTLAGHHEVWSFRQSYAWIAGTYKIVSPALTPGATYFVEYWSDNLAQGDACTGSLTYDDAHPDES
jgi:hypothetical protein